jgi:hypothetical protein
MHAEETELIRLLAIKAIWPRRGRAEFPTDLKLANAIAEQLKRLELRMAAEKTWPSTSCNCITGSS